MAVMSRLNMTWIFKPEEDRDLWATEVKKFIEDKSGGSLPVTQASWLQPFWIGGNVNKDNHAEPEIP